ncbi:MAG: uroporphyrinogen-III synthase [Rhodospirillales bacterium]
MKILLTRPEQDSVSFAERLAEGGVDAVITPLMRVEYLNGPPPDLSGVQALLVTSANGVRAFAERVSDRTLPVYAVGDATAREARLAGFETVTSAGGDVEDLAALVRDRCDPTRGTLLHIAGTAVAGDLGGALLEASFDYRREVMYEVHRAERLPPEALAAFGYGDLAGVALFSPRSARIFEECVDTAGRSADLARLIAFVLSGNVAEALRRDAWHEIRVAAEPTADAILKMVLDAAETR